MADKTEMWVMVKCRDKRIICDWGLDTAWSATQLGFQEALRKAMEYKESEEKMWSNMEYMIDGGEW